MDGVAGLVGRGAAGAITLETRRAPSYLPGPMPGELKSLTEERARKLRKLAIILSLVVGIIGLPAGWFGPPLYSNLQQGRLVRQARRFIAGGDYQAAVGRLHRALGYNADNLDALRLLAAVAEKGEMRQAVGLRKRVSQGMPGSFDDACAWADDAFRFNDLDEAAQALAIMRRVRPGDARCHEAAAKLAAASRQQKKADAEFAEALRLDPANETFQLESAINALASDTQDARARLEKLSANPKVRLPALRALAGEALARHRFASALSLFQKITAEPDATFEDRLAFMNVLQVIRQPFLFTQITAMEAAAKGDSWKTARLLSWMNGHAEAMIACEWLGALPPDFIAKPPVACEAARSYLLVLDWKKLRVLASSGNWDSYEFVRKAFLARALREAGDPHGSENCWSDAVILAARQPERLSTLERMAAAWDWQTEGNDVLWLLAEVSDQPLETLHFLAGRYAAAGNTHQLLRVWTKVREIAPSDAEAQNNWARLALLLSAEKDEAARTAADLAEKNPAVPDIIATHALALHLRKHTDEGLLALRSLKPEDLTQPSVAAIYGILLAAKNSPDAAKYLDLAAQAPLYPEEKDLVAQARAPAEKPVEHPRGPAAIQLPSQLPAKQSASREPPLIELPSQLPAKTGTSQQPSLIKLPSQLPAKSK